MTSADTPSMIWMNTRFGHWRHGFNFRDGQGRARSLCGRVLDEWRTDHATVEEQAFPRCTHCLKWVAEIDARKAHDE